LGLGFTRLLGLESTPVGVRVEGGGWSFRGHFGNYWGDARPGAFERSYVWRLFTVPGCPVSTPGIGVERPHMRSFVNDFQLRVVFLLRLQLKKPIFQTTLKDIQKDKEWLSQPKTKIT
jgi:hypothetical protein